MQRLYFIFYLIIIGLLPQVSIGQSMYLIDSLTKKLETTQGIQRIDILLLLSQEHWALDTLKANDYARQAYASSHEMGYTKGLVWGISYQGVPHEYYGDVHTALVFYRKGLELAKKYGFQEGIAESYGNIAIAHKELNQNDSATMYYHKSLDILKKTKNLLMLSEQYSNVSLLHVGQAQYDSGLYYMDLAKETAIQDGNKEMEASCYETLGGIETKLGRLGKATDYYFKALHIYEEIHNDGGIANVYDHLGALYEDLDNNEKSIEHYEKALKIREEVGDKVGVPTSLNNVGQAYISVKEYDKAMEYLQRGYDLSLEMKNSSLASSFMHNIGSVHSRQKKYEAAIEEYKKSLAISVKEGSRYSICNTSMTMGNAYYQLYKRDSVLALRDSSVALYERGLKIAQDIGVKPMIEVASSHLGHLYYQDERYKESAEMYRLQLKMADSLNDQQQQRTIAEMDAKYQMRQNAMEMEALRKQHELNEKRIEQQQQLFIALGFILFLTLILSVVLYKNNQRTKVVNAELARQQVEIQQRNEEILIQQEAIERQNQILASRNEELKTLDDEKNYLIGVVAHDLKSPINQIKGLLGIVKFDIDRLSDNAKKMLEMADHILENTSEMIAKILDLKAIESNSLNLKIVTYDVKAQIHEIVESFQGVANQKSIELKFETDEGNIQWPLDKNLIEQVMENLISNAIKFSPNRRTVTIETKVFNDQLRLSVSDEGPGIHPDEAHKLFKKYQKLSAKPTAGESSTGLGLSIVKKYVEAMRGEIRYESVWGKGATFIAEFNA